MSLRLMRKQFIDRKPLWHNKNGEPFFLPIGAAPDGEGGSQSGSGSDGGSSGDSSGEGGEGAPSGESGAAGNEGSGSGTESKDKEGTVSLSEFEALKARMQAADRRASDAENKVKEAERKEKTDLENAQSDLTEAKKQNETLAKTVSDLRLQVAFLSANEIKWHDPETALRLADLSGVSIDDDGTVDKKALKAALDKLSKEKSYLVKKEDGGGGTSGSPVGSGRSGSGSKTDDKTLRRKFPALASRG